MISPPIPGIRMRWPASSARLLMGWRNHPPIWPPVVLAGIERMPNSA